MEIIHKINGKNYVLVVDFIKSATGLIECKERIEKHDCIFHKFEYADTGIFGDKRKTNVYILVPEEKIMSFNRDIISLD